MKDPTKGSPRTTTRAQRRYHELVDVKTPMRDPFLPKPTMKRHKP